MTDAEAIGSERGFHRRRVVAGLLMGGSFLGQPGAGLAARLAGAGQGERRFGRFAYVGCRTTRERNARGDGIQVYRIDPKTGAWTHVQLVPGLVNPSFLCLDSFRRFLYAVHGDGSEVSAFGVDDISGTLTPIGRFATGGRNPVHLTVDPGNRFLLVANYATGTVAVLPRRPAGGLEPVRQLVPLPGAPGPDPKEQASSHPHEVAWSPDRRHLLVPDKGLDRIFAFRFDAAAGRLVPAAVPFVQAPPGVGPRHLAFHPRLPLAYVAHELASSVGAYRYDPSSGGFAMIQALSSVPAGASGTNTAAEVVVGASGRFVYVSNRGHDSVAAFAVADDGRLSHRGWTPAGGSGPRFMAIDPSATLLHVANETSDTIVAFRLAENGTLTRNGPPVATGSPVCVVFLA